MFFVELAEMGFNFGIIWVLGMETLNRDHLSFRIIKIKFLIKSKQESLLTKIYELLLVKMSINDSMTDGFSNSPFAEEQKHWNFIVLT